MRDKSVVKISVTPSTKYSCSGSPLKLAKGRTTIERRGGVEGGFACAGFAARVRVRAAHRDYWLAESRPEEMDQHFQKCSR